MKSYKVLYIYIIVLLWYQAAQAQTSCDDGCACAAEDITPAGIMTGHVHEKGKWMVSYSYNHVSMQGNISGTNKISDADIYKNYVMAPNSMTMDMHMLMLMYGATDKLTFMVMPSFTNMWMNMNMVDAGKPMIMPGMKAEAVMPNEQTIAGFGDTKIYGIYSILKNDQMQFTASMGLSIPTGNIDATVFNDMYDHLRADYNMQTGTGTVDFMPSLNVAFHHDFIEWGAAISGIWHLFYNKNGYHQGNEGMAQLWAAKKWNSWLSNSIRVEAIADGSLAGSDAGLYASMEPSAYAANYGGFKANIYPGINFYPGSFLSTACKIRLEYGLPVYQYAQGIQMANQSYILANLDLIF